MTEGDFRPAVTVDGEDVVYSASSLGSCTRALAAARQEMEPYTGPLPENIAAVFGKGREAEERGIEWFTSKGWTVTDRQREFVLPITRRISVVGHVDFIVGREVEPTLPPVVIDSKRQNDDEFAKKSIRDSWLWYKYKWQFSSYMIASGLPFAVQRLNDNGDVKLEPLTVAPCSEQEIRARVLEIEAMAGRELRGEECDKNDFPCPYWRVLHDREEKVEEREDTELGDLALHYRRVSDDVTVLSERRGQIRKELLKRVEGTVRETVSGIVVKVTTYSTKEKVIPAGEQTRVTVRLPED